MGLKKKISFIYLMVCYEDQVILNVIYCEETKFYMNISNFYSHLWMTVEKGLTGSANVRQLSRETATASRRCFLIFVPRILILKGKYKVLGPFVQPNSTSIILKG